MKMKLKWKILSFFLAMLTLLPIFPIQVFSAEAADEITSLPDIRILHKGAPVGELLLQQDGKETLSVDSPMMGELSYRWQIRRNSASAPWIDITDKDQKSCDVTYALVGSMLDASGRTQLRCVITSAGAEFASEPVLIVLSFAQAQANESPAPQAAPVARAMRFAAAPATAAEMTDGTPALAAENQGGIITYNVTVHFVYSNGEIANDPYTMGVSPGTSINQSIPVGRIVGYAPKLQEDYPNLYFDPETLQMQLTVSQVTGPMDFYVIYEPAVVNFTVHHHLQNLLDDQYSPEAYATVTMQGYTGSSVGDNCQLEIEGFYALYYERMTIAADGSTQLEIYYDREYYLIDFDIGGGYGQEPIYTRYGSEISVNDAQRPGYVFNGWALTWAHDQRPTEDQMLEFSFTATKHSIVVRYNLVYTALWTLGTTSYTLVFWRENADDNNYSYWTSITITTDESGQPLRMDSVVDAENRITETPIQAIKDESQYYTFNAVRSDKNVELSGDGSTVVNAYYTRNRYTLTFKAPGNCSIPQNHVHTDACYLDLCGKTAHVHDETCNRDPICGLHQHPEHDKVNCHYICNIETEHPYHTADCLICEHNEHLHNSSCCQISWHTHVAACCNKKEHVHGPDCCTAPRHTTSCYGVNVGSAVNSPASSAGSFPQDPEDGELYIIRVREWFSTKTYRYIHINGQWYNFNDTKYNQNDTGKVIAPSACKNNTHHIHGDGKCTYCADNLEVHTHGDGKCNIICGLQQHTHAEGEECKYCDIAEHVHHLSCYKDVAHVHMDYCCNWEIHTHTDECYECVAHTHEADARLLICALPTNHQHTTKCDSSKETNTVKTVTRKYEQSLADLWPVIDDNGVSYIDGQRWDPSTYYNEVLVYLASMPPANITLTLSTSSYKPYTMHYMLEVLPSERNDKDVTTYNGRYFKEAFSVQACYNHITEKEDFFDIKGFDQWTSDPAFSGSSISPSDRIAHFYYTRKTGEEIALSFYSVNAEVARHYGGDIMYGAPVSAYRDYVPPYPSTYEPNAYVFAGWYLSSSCAPGTEADWDTLTVPDGELQLYAKWTPINHVVEIYTDARYTTQIGATLTVPHGTLINEPPHPSNGNLSFSGWFYLDEYGTEKAFVFNAIPIKRDMKIYAKWSSSTPVQYVIRYVTINEDNEVIEIAPPTLGSTLAGQNRTFEAKGAHELYAPYSEFYFPETRSHSLVMKANELNTYTFYYTYKNNSPYTVKYQDKAGNPLAPDKVVSDNRLALVTETFVPISGYMPDSYQKRLIVSSNPEDNVLIFEYTEDTVHARYLILHYQQDVGGTGYTERSKTEIMGVIGELCGASSILIEGFSLARVEINGTPVTPDANGTVSEVLPKDGMLIAFYYDRVEVEYTVEFVDFDDPTKHLFPAITKTGIFGTSIKEIAKDLTAIGYELTSVSEKSITLKSTGYNLITFTYQERYVNIYYVARVEDTVIPNYGVDPVKAVSGLPHGCTSFGSNDYQFVGWYKDEECTVPVDPSIDPVTLDQDGNLMPTKTTKVVEGQTVEVYESTTYYILFDYKYVDLTITVEGCSDPEQIFLFYITGLEAYNSNIHLVVSIKGNGSVRLEYLQTGAYQVTQANNWSWRYTPDATVQEISLNNVNPNPAARVLTFTQTLTNDKWLAGNGYSQILMP